MQDDDDIPDLDLRGMVREADHNTSIAAAVQQAAKRTKLQVRILQILWERGGMTDEQLWSLPEFAHYDQSTVRKRRSELYQAGFVVKAGVRINSRGFVMTVWAVAPLTPKTPPPPPVVVRRTPPVVTRPTAPVVTARRKP